MECACVALSSTAISISIVAAAETWRRTEGSLEEVATMSAGDWQGNVYVGSGWMLYAGPLGESSLHRHHAIQVVLARRGTVILRDGQGSCSEATAAVVPADVRHATPAPVESAFLLYVDSDSAAGRRIGTPRVEDAASWTRRDDLFARLALEPEPQTAVAARALAHRIALTLSTGAGTRPRPAVRHPSVARALSRLPAMLAHDGPRLRVADLAAIAGPSESRFSRVFNRDVGMSIPAYVRWLRLRLVADSIMKGQSLTDAAHEAGFSDSAHLSRVFRTTFGVRPSELTACSRFHVSDLELT